MGLAAHLVVQVQVVKLSVGPEVLRVPVQGEVDVASVALDHHRVPVVVVQQAARGHGGVAQDGAVLVAACNSHIGINMRGLAISRVKFVLFEGGMRED